MEKNIEFQDKQRIIQEFVPGKQITLAHIIANPDPALFKKLGVLGERSGALGIMTITPSEGAIIGADVASTCSTALFACRRLLQLQPAAL